MNAPSLLHAADDNFDSEFPGCVLTHCFYLTGDQTDIAVAALTAISHIGAKLDGMSRSRTGGAMHHKLRVTGIKPKEARSLVGRLAMMPGVTCATVEHLISPAPSSLLG
ncbi:hypothetical protein AEAC466_11995 [Asticcacaulis sp. AC466]|uniref:hypothetical protein n=1 Tax=Asticcacaulis sp. AC466 TaxID=1282362 RepID=UPI0003C3D4F0|nr:hypothetical protein [Asticcacaulis sp. AC466]ESQ83722.1 hypothetical protein AEAC466_11995 [Asticcacaulis sp. AC466]